MKAKPLLLLVFSSLFIQCRMGDDDMILPPPPAPCVYNCDTSKLTVLWQHPINKDTLECGSIHPLVLDDGVLFSETYCSDKEVLQKLNKYTGNPIWYWDEYSNSTSASTHAVFIYQNNIAYNSGVNISLIDGENGQSVWTISPHPDNGWPRSVVFGNYVFTPRHTDGNNGYDYLVRINIETGQWEVLYTRYVTNGYTPSLEPPGFWLKSNGDTVLVFQNRSTANSFPHHGQIDLFAYNMTQGNMEWEIIDLDADGNSNVRPPLVWEDKIYFAGSRMMYCIDAPTHEIIWTKPLYQMLMSNWLIANEKLIVKPDNDEIFALNPHTGEEIWRETGSGETCGDMVYHDGMVYFNCLGTGKLYAVDVETGEHVWAEHPPNRKKGFKGASFYDGVAVDPERGVLYTSDEFFALCIKLPER